MSRHLDVVRAMSIEIADVGSVCHWTRSACAVAPQWYVVWAVGDEREVELYCQRHYVLALDWWVSVERLSASRVFDYSDRGRL